mmetsp:Transcript_23914/g.34299  ORF Transcript_23914/g.34299 Transcript_23914/m.34299 type:complete len:92 (-) Transcript_23914:10-285(-)
MVIIRTKMTTETKLGTTTVAVVMPMGEGSDVTTTMETMAAKIKCVVVLVRNGMKNPIFSLVERKKGTNDDLYKKYSTCPEILKKKVYIMVD